MGAPEQEACWVCQVAHLNIWRTRERGPVAAGCTHCASFGGAIERPCRWEAKSPARRVTLPNIRLRRAARPFDRV